MENDAPDVAELNEAELLINSIYQTLVEMDRMVTQLGEIGPKSMLAPAATHYKNVVDLEDAIDKLRIRVYHIYNGYAFHVLPDLFKMSSVTTTQTLNGYNITIADDMNVSIPPESKMEAYDWLANNGYGDIITNTINSSTLKATIKGMYKDGIVVPEDVFKVSPIKKLRVVASAKKIPSSTGGGGQG
jgi:hypothetical protein